MSSFSIKSVYSKNKKEILILSALSLLTIFFKVYNLELRMPFGWDQARDAGVAWQMLVELKPTLIGPQVVSDNAFFLGPLWYYLLLPFFIITRLDPIALGLAVTTSAVLTLAAFYLFLKKIAGQTAAIIGSLILSCSPDVLAWNPVLVPIFSIAIFYSLIKLLEGNQKFLIISSLLFGLSLQIHVQMVFFIIPIAITLIYFLKKNRFPAKELLISISVFALTFAPLIFFDLRHDFVNSKGIIKIFSSSSNSPVNLNYLDQLSITYPKTVYSNFFLPNLGIDTTIIGPLIILISTFGLLKLKSYKVFKSLMLITLFLPVFVFSFYKGRLSEYYFYICLVPLLTGFSTALQLLFRKKVIGKAAVVLFLIWVSILNIQTLFSMGHGNGLLYQKQAIEFLKNQKEDSQINVSFDVPYGDDAGMKYLLKYYQIEAMDTPDHHLWTISIPAGNSPDLKASFGNIGIVRK